jgi:hypothetical protein
MPDQKQYPKLIWAVVAVILLILIGYALYQGQILREITFPGGGAKFEPKPKDESLAFVISYDLPKAALQGQTVIYLGGAVVVTLFVDRNNKLSSTATGKVPAAGSYSYRLEQDEVYPASEDAPYVHKVHRTGQGEVAPISRTRL